MTALSAPGEIRVSPDGDSVYVAASFSSGVSVFNRDETSGALQVKPGQEGCITESGNSASASLAIEP